MSGVDGSFDTRPAWPGPSEGELRPFRPADAKAARERRSAPQSADASAADASSDAGGWLEDLSIDLLEHLSVLSELVTTTTDGSRLQVKALAAKVTALAATIDSLSKEIRALRNMEQAPMALSDADLERLAAAVAAELRSAFRVVPPGRDRP